jgi:hypothetical protein
VLFLRSPKSLRPVAYQRALVGIRATKRGDIPVKPLGVFCSVMSRSFSWTCDIRPEECFRLERANHQNGVVEITHGKTD